jgi:hypothetical protein
MSGESGGCVEVAAAESCVLVRDSRDHPGAMLTFSPAQWRQFVRRIKTAGLRRIPDLPDWSGKRQWGGIAQFLERRRHVIMWVSESA